MTAVRVLGAVLLGMALAVLMAMVGSWGAALPGVSSQFLEPTPLWAMLATSSGFAGGVAVMSWIAARSLQGGGELMKSSAVLLVDTLGLRLPLRRAGLVVAVGVVGAVVIYGLVVTLVASAPFPQPAVPDVRWEAVGAAPGWAAGVYFAVVAAPFEEMVFRGGLLALAAAASTASSTRGRVYVLGLLVASSLVFGLIHLGHSVATVVTWGIAGLVLGGLALAFRSVLAPVVAHAGANFLIGWTQL